MPSCNGRRISRFDDRCHISTGCLGHRSRPVLILRQRSLGPKKIALILLNKVIELLLCDSQLLCALLLGYLLLGTILLQCLLMLLVGLLSLLKRMGVMRILVSFPLMSSLLLKRLLPSCRLLNRPLHRLVDPLLHRLLSHLQLIFRLLSCQLLNCLLNCRLLDCTLRECLLWSCEMPRFHA